MLFENLDDVDAAIMLGLTHSSRMVAGWKRIRVLLTKWESPWAGDRIICVGAEADNLPDRNLSEEEINRLHSRSKHSYYDFMGDSTSINSRGMCSISTPFMAGGGQSTNTRVNLCKKEYTASYAARMRTPFYKECIDPEGCDAQDLTPLFVVLICWSSNSFDYHMHRGARAGGRFVVTMVGDFDAMRAKKPEEERKDITASTLSEWGVIMKEVKAHCRRPDPGALSGHIITCKRYVFDQKVCYKLLE